MAGVAQFFSIWSRHSVFSTSNCLVANACKPSVIIESDDHLHHITSDRIAVFGCKMKLFVTKPRWLEIKVQSSESFQVVWHSIMRKNEVHMDSFDGKRLSASQQSATNHSSWYHDDSNNFFCNRGDMMGQPSTEFQSEVKWCRCGRVGLEGVRPKEANV